MKQKIENPPPRGRCWKGVLLCLAPFAAVSLDAQIIAEDSFDYTVGDTLAGDSLDGGQGWGAAATESSSDWALNSGREDGTVISGSLSYSDGTNSLVTGGNAVTGSPTSQDAVDVQRNLDSDVTSGDFWFSALMRTDNTATVNTLIFADDQTTGDPGIVVTVGSDISIDGAGGTSSTGGTPLATASANTTYFVVGNYRKVSGGPNDEFELWVNPDLGGASPVNAVGNDTATITSSEIVNTGNPLNNARWRVTGNTSGSADLDEVRIGRTFGDVAPIPEPGAFALLAGLTGLGMVMLRRRR